MSTLDVAAGAIHRDETVETVLLLAFAGGYIDAYTWTIHGVMANAQTANLIFLWVYAVFGFGAAAGALATKTIPSLALGLPVVALLIVLLRCEASRHEVAQ